MNDNHFASDNAGCYHTAKLIATIPALSRQQDLHIKRWDFSEAQDGMHALKDTLLLLYII